MEQLKEILAIGDELNLYLVVNGLKPTTMIELSSLNPALDTKIAKSEELRENVRYAVLRVKPDVVDYLKKYLDGSGAKYKNWEQENISDVQDSKGNKISHQSCHDQLFYVGSNQGNLERLLSAKTDKEVGLALGFPTESVEAYQKIIDNERIDGSYVPVSLAKAKKAGIELPTWLAYICFVPEKLDLIKDDVSPSSKRLGKKYQDYVRNDNPDLAKRVEQDFLNRKLPDSWQKTPDKGYACCYKFQPNNS